MVRKDPEATREYNRQRAAKQYEDYKIRRNALIERLGGECYLCPEQGELHLHHVEYHETESDYARSGRSLYVRLKRVAEAESNPDRFRLLCPKCHRVLEGVKAMMQDGMDRQKLRELLEL